MKSVFTTTEELRKVLIDNGYIGIQFCDIECSEHGDIFHYQLLKPGQEITEGCADLGKIPLLSKEGYTILEEYLTTDRVAIYPDPLTLLNIDTKL